MLKSDIIEAIGTAIERKIGGEWKHEVVILGMSADFINVEIDQKEYVLKLNEVEDGHNFSEYL